MWYCAVSEVQRGLSRGGVNDMLGKEVATKTLVMGTFHFDVP